MSEQDAKLRLKDCKFELLFFRKSDSSVRGDLIKLQLEKFRSIIDKLSKLHNFLEIELIALSDIEHPEKFNEIAVISF